MNTAQELYDTVARGIYNQGCRSINRDGVCQYRLGNLKCGIGQLIPDDKYNPEWDEYGATVVNLIEGCDASEDRVAVEATFPEWEPHKDLLANLQLAHDCLSDERFKERWLIKVQGIAWLYNLTPFTP